MAERDTTTTTTCTSEEDVTHYHAYTQVVILVTIVGVMSTMVIMMMEPMSTMVMELMIQTCTDSADSEPFSTRGRLGLRRRGGRSRHKGRSLADGQMPSRWPAIIKTLEYISSDQFKWSKCCHSVLQMYKRQMLPNFLECMYKKNNFQPQRVMLQLCQKGHTGKFNLFTVQVWILPFPAL